MWPRLASLALLPLICLAGCSSSSDPTDAAATAANGSDPAELVFIFQKQRDPTQIKTNADKAAAFLSNELGIPVKAVVPTEYAASVQALVSKQADFAYISAVPFLLARRDGGATLLLTEQRIDPQGKARTSYDSVFVVRADSSLHSIGDIVAEAADLRMVFTSTTSTSGYIMAYARLVDEGLLIPKQDPREVFASVNFAGSYTLALQQVLESRADLCAVSYYTVEGDTADVYTTAEEREKLRIIARTPNVPTHLICARGGLSNRLKDRVKAALIKLSHDQPDLLKNVYGAMTFVETDEDQHVAAAVGALNRLGMPIEKFVK